MIKEMARRCVRNETDHALVEVTEWSSGEGFGASTDVDGEVADYNFAWREWDALAQAVAVLRGDEEPLLEQSAREEIKTAWDQVPSGFSHTDPLADVVRKMSVSLRTVQTEAAEWRRKYESLARAVAVVRAVELPE